MTHEVVSRTASSYMAAYRAASPRDRASLLIVAAALLCALSLVLAALTIRAACPAVSVAAADPRERAPRVALVPARTAEARVEAPAPPERSPSVTARANTRNILQRRL
jgi:hypothetical protein